MPIERKSRPIKISDEPLRDRELEAFEKIDELVREELPNLLDSIISDNAGSVFPTDLGPSAEYHRPEKKTKKNPDIFDKAV